MKPLDRIQTCNSIIDISAHLVFRYMGSAIPDPAIISYHYYIDSLNHTSFNTRYLHTISNRTQYSLQSKQYRMIKNNNMMSYNTNFCVVSICTQQRT